MIRDAKWITLVKCDQLYNAASHGADYNRSTFVGADNKQRTWESMERKTRSKDSKVDAVGILAILEKPTGPELLLQKQFRPPVDKVCIEIPAGLLDEGETPEACAIRELKEETGYIGEVISHDGVTASPIMFNDPGMCRSELATTN